MMIGTRLQAAGKAASASCGYTPIHGRVLQRKCACGGSHGIGTECGDCSSEQVQMQRSAGHQGEPSTVPSIVGEVLQSPGQSLDAQVRTFIEPRFGHDFGGVRVHTDGRAAESATAVHARAYTVGRDVVFGAGQYAPRTPEGLRLIAHELTHVAQQRDAHGGGLTVGRADSVAEREADDHAARISTGQSSPALEASSGALQRQPAGGSGSAPPSAPIERERSVTLEPHLDLNLIDLSLRVLRGEHRLTITPGLSNPLNILGTPIPGIQPAQLSLLLGYENRCNRAFQSALVGMRQTQPPGRLAPDFGRNPMQIEASGSFRSGSWRIDPGATVSFTGSTLDSVFLTLTFASGVSTTIPPDCIAPPSPPPVRDSPPPAGGTPDTTTPETGTGRTGQDIPPPSTREPALPSYTLYFFYDTTMLRPESNPTVQQVVTLLQTVPSLHVMLTGHASLEGTVEYNRDLSERRAEFMHTWIGIQGIAGSRIHTMHFGESAPAVPEPEVPERTLALSVERIRMMNRRVEVTFFDPTGAFGATAPQLRLPTLGWSRRRLLEPSTPGVP